MKEYILAVNAGSSSLKISLFVLSGSEQIELDFTAVITGANSDRKIRLKDGQGRNIESRAFSESLSNLHGENPIKIVPEILKFLRPVINLKGIGHRVVHGGNQFSGPVLIDALALSALEKLIPFAPLHQPLNLAPIKFFSETFPQIPQVACFDTSFHGTQSDLNKIVPLPKRFRDAGICNYGFHGLSYEYIASRLKSPESRGKINKVIVAHLGSGASICAIKDGKSIATSMGFSALSGIVMGTRPGNLDPGILLYLMEHYGLNASELENLLYKESGLLAVSGVSADMQALLASSDPQAQMAVDLFVYRISREIGSLTAAMGGLGAIVFTGGIGENSADIRERVCSQAAWLGVDINSKANLENQLCISVPQSKVLVQVIPADENMMIALHSKQLLR